MLDHTTAVVKWRLSPSACQRLRRFVAGEESTEGASV